MIYYIPAEIESGNPEGVYYLQPTMHPVQIYTLGIMRNWPFYLKNMHSQIAIFKQKQSLYPFLMKRVHVQKKENLLHIE